MRNLQGSPATQPIAEHPQPTADTQVDTEPVTQVTEPASDAVAQETEEEIKLLNSIYSATVKRINLGREVRVLRSQLDNLEEELRSASETESSLLKSLPETLLKMRDGLLDQPVSSDESPQQHTSEPVDAPSWQEIPTAEFAKAVPGLGPTKLEKLAEQYPTAFDLETARIDASKENAHFAKKLPRGIGESIADELTERLMKAQTDADEPPASQVVEPVVNAPVTSEEEYEDVEYDEVETPSNGPGEDSDEIDLAHEQWARSTANVLWENRSTGSLVAGPDENNKAAWDAGFEAHSEGLPVTEGYGLDEPMKEAWVKGWLSSQLLEKCENTSQPETESEPQPTGSAPNDPPSQPSDDDDGGPFHEKFVEGFVRHVRESGDTAFKHSQEAWNAGYQSGVDEQPVEACPTLDVSVNFKRDWIRGWVKGSEVTVL